MRGAAHDGGADEEFHAGDGAGFRFVRFFVAVEEGEARVGGGVDAAAVGIAAGDFEGLFGEGVDVAGFEEAVLDDGGDVGAAGAVEGDARLDEVFDCFFDAGAVAAPAVVGDVLSEGLQVFAEEGVAHFVLDLLEAPGEVAADDGFDVFDAVAGEDVGADFFRGFAEVVVRGVGGGVGNTANGPALRGRWFVLARQGFSVCLDVGGCFLQKTENEHGEVEAILPSYIPLFTDAFT